MALVGRDENGNLIGPIVRKGLPNLQTAMPQYSDYTDAQIQDLAAYIHYLRRQGRYKELSRLASQSTGDAKAGEAYFKANCVTCHAAPLARQPAKELAGKILRPGPESLFQEENLSAGAAAHLKLLERYTDAEFTNLLAYLK
jgi:mono/diheme cytochrome c family protein